MRFTAFTASAEPAEVMEMLHDCHPAKGAIVVAHEGTLERVAGDSVTVFFSDPVQIDRPAEAAVRMTLAMQAAFVPLCEAWRKRGFSLGPSCGVAQGYATLGNVGNVTNLPARLCGEAAAGQVLVDRKIVARLDGQFDAQPAGPFALTGLAQPMPAFAVLGWVAG